jgi:nucleotide-binding universal stress UspA family protein
MVPLDGSKLAEAALAYLPALRALGNFRVTLIRVVDGERVSIGEAMRYLEDIGEQLRQKTGQEVNWISREGTPQAQIQAEAANPWVVGMLMATHGHSGPEPWRLGGVADKLIRGALCPTLIVSPAAADARAPEAFERILVPLDGSVLAEEALPVATEFARRAKSRLWLVSAYMPAPVAPIPYPGGTYRDRMESSQEAAQEYLADLKIETGGAAVERLAVHGQPVEALMKQIEEQAIDLVIMTSHGRGGFLRWALGSVTDWLIRGQVPVMVIQPGQGERLVKLLQA